MKFSVVIPLYNKVEFVKDTLRSLVNQTKLPHEIIIVDDKSTDGSLKEVSRFLENQQHLLKEIRIEIIELKNNKGIGNARNVGFLKTTGDIVSFLDADDIYTAKLIETVDMLMRFYKIDFFVLGIQMFSSQTIYPNINKLQGQLTPITSNAYQIKQPLKTITSLDFYMGVGSNVMVKRDWLLNEKFIDKKIFYQGIDYWYRIVKEIVNNGRQNTIGLLMGNFLKVREVPGSASRKKYKRWDAIDIPPLITRFYNSKNTYDKLMMGVVGKRWLKHVMKNLNSTTQKLSFIYKYRKICMRQFHYFILRKLL